MDDRHSDSVSVPAPRDEAAQAALMRADLVDLEASELRSLLASTVISAALVPLLVMLLRLVVLDSPWRAMFLASIVGWIGILGFGWHRYFHTRSERLRHAEELELLEQVASADGPQEDGA